MRLPEKAGKPASRHGEIRAIIPLLLFFLLTDSDISLIEQTVSYLKLAKLEASSSNHRAADPKYKGAGGRIRC